MRIVSIGEVLWDIFPDGERLGGAPFNFAVRAHRLGHEVKLISAVGHDDRGCRAIAEAQRHGLSTGAISVTNEAPTGHVTIGFDASGEPDYTIHRPAAYDFLRVPERIDADWVYYGTLLGKPEVARVSGARRFYDVNLRRDSYTIELVRLLLESANVVKANQAEAREIGLTIDGGRFDAVCITRGADGCSVRVGDEVVDAAGYPLSGGDPVGAGDAFAAAFLHGVDAGWPVGEIADFANRMGAEAASRVGAI
jgi:fructokinase